MSAPDGASRCPRCATPLLEGQDWCLECGAPARTRLAPTPNWRVPAAVVAVLVALAGGALAFAFVELTDDDEQAATAPTAAPPASQPAAPAPDPGAAAPGTPAPGTTAPSMGAPDAGATAPPATPQPAPPATAAPEGGATPPAMQDEPAVP